MVSEFLTELAGRFSDVLLRESRKVARGAKSNYFCKAQIAHSKSQNRAIAATGQSHRHHGRESTFSKHANADFPDEARRNTLVLSGTAVRKLGSTPVLEYSRCRLSEQSEESC